MFCHSLLLYAIFIALDLFSLIKFELIVFAFFFCYGIFHKKIVSMMTLFPVNIVPSLSNKKKPQSHTKSLFTPNNQSKHMITNEFRHEGQL